MQIELNFPENLNEKCNCLFCREYRFYNAAIQRRDVDELLELVKYFANKYWSVDEELEILKDKNERQRQILELSQEDLLRARVYGTASGGGDEDKGQTPVGKV